MMKTLVVTGGIGSGKSLVCSFLAERGLPVYDSDSRTKMLYDSSPELLARIGDAVGTDVTGADGRLDRKRLASVVFSDGERLEALERVVHPAVLDDFYRWKAEAERSLSQMPEKIPFVVFESAIILEKPLFRSVADVVLLVDAPMETRIARACARDGAGRGAVLERMSRQKLLNGISSGLVTPDADYVIVNDGTVESLRGKVGDFLSGLLRQCHSVEERGTENLR